MVKTFQYDKNIKCQECIEYLKQLDTNNNIFECIYLRILPEDIIILRHNNEGPPKRYSKGDLMCIARADYNVSERCKGVESPKLNKEGNLEAICKWPLGKIIIIKLEKELKKF